MVKSRCTWLALGLLVGLTVGLNLAGIWPQVPVHAVATHGQENFAICTGPVDMDVEGVFILDYLTGMLKGAVLNMQTRTFSTFYEYNVSRDLMAAGQKNPHYLMVTGVTNMRQGAQTLQLGRTVIYVAESSTGQIAAYGMPWVAGRANVPVAQATSFILLDGFRFRTTAVRNQ